MVIFHCLPALAIRLNWASPSSALGFAFRTVGESVAFAAAVIYSDGGVKYAWML